MRGVCGCVGVCENLTFSSSLWTALNSVSRTRCLHAEARLTGAEPPELAEFVERAASKPRADAAGAAGHFALGLPMRRMVALIAESGSPAVPTDAEPPRSCALCAAFGREAAEESAEEAQAAACALCVGASLRALRMIPESDALAACSSRDARALLAPWERALQGRPGKVHADIAAVEGVRA